MDNTESQYELIKLRADEEVADAVRAYINENKIVGVHLVADAKRYYPYGSLASHVIGLSLIHISSSPLTAMRMA